MLTPALSLLFALTFGSASQAGSDGIVTKPVVTANNPTWLDPVQWKSGAVVLVVRPAEAKWRMLPPPQPKDGRIMILPDQYTARFQDFQVLAASLPNVPSKVTLRIQADSGTKNLRAIPAEPPSPAETFLVLLDREKDVPWSADQPEVTRALIRYSGHGLKSGKDAKRVLFDSLTSDLEKRSPEGAEDAYSWMGDYYRSMVERKHGQGLAAYLTDVSKDPDDAKAAAMLASSATLAKDPISRLYLSYLAGVWGNEKGFTPFFDAADEAKDKQQRIVPSILESVVDAGRFPVLPPHDAVTLAFKYKGNALFTFFLSFAEVGISKDDLKAIYLTAKGKSESDRCALYRFTVGWIGFPLSEDYPKGAYPIWRFGHMENESGVVSKLNDYFGISDPIHP